MERTSWTDERLDDFTRHVESRFDRLERDIRDLGLELRAEINGVRITLIRVGGGIMAGLVGVIVAVLARGV